jgi:hypothetical protein
MVFRSLPLHTGEYSLYPSLSSWAISDDMQSISATLVGLASRLLAISLLLATGTIFVDYARILYRRRSLPPGPFPWPLVGNYFQTPKDRPWLEWEHWSKRYDSPMFTLWIGREPRIIINDAWVACDLMEKRADVWSSRPHLVAMGDALGMSSTNQTNLPYGDRWRLHRRLMVSLT